MEIILGMVGALLLVAAFAAGLVLGSRYTAPAATGKHSITDEERKVAEQAEAERKAFNDLQAYTVEQAYGITEKNDNNEGGAAH